MVVDIMEVTMAVGTEAMAITMVDAMAVITMDIILPITTTDPLTEEPQEEFMPRVAVEKVVMA